ncbi:hypothetical protein BGW38_002038 [Lunasporangiospora selenospora]|uniref:Neocarzinostatin family protein n=1 Tax=Lunasporangiospora selenospora TaxID=979761 RepID=A0A9P6KD57_9FUNG|nr:hypothetical protein BGW38_002038 [Lunasporangiospora selenospora]
MHLQNSFAAFLIVAGWSLPSSILAVPVSSCIIATPAQTLAVGRPYQVQFTNCRGTGGTVKLRSGSPVSLRTEPFPACSGVTFSSGTCTFTPKTAGQGFVFSAVDQTGLETFSGQFNVVATGPSTPQTQPAPAKQEPQVKPAPVVPAAATAGVKNTGVVQPSLNSHSN